jgi:hypothetical protein
VLRVLGRELFPPRLPRVPGRPLAAVSARPLALESGRDAAASCASRRATCSSSSESE